MIRVKNNLNQPQMVAGRSLPADGEFSVRAVDENLRRLEEKGLISIIEPVPEKPKEKEKVEGEKK